MPRPPPRDLDAALRDPGFTPRRDEIEAVLARVVAGGDDAERAAKALARAEAEVVPVAVALLRSATERSAARIVRLLGRRDSREPSAHPALFALLEDTRPSVRRAAVSALGRLAHRDDERALLTVLDHETDGSVRRALVEALGKLGGATARAVVGAIARAPGEDAELGRRAEISELRTARGLVPRASWRVEVTPREPLEVHFRCRAGLESWLAEELGPRARVLGDGRVLLRGASSLAELGRARIATEFALVFRGPLGESLPAAALALLGDEHRVRAITAFTRGRPRYRLELAEAGKQRAALAALVRDLERRAPELLNDPRESDWHVTLRAHAGELLAEWVPHGLPDPRWAYRREVVPGASHPTVAAALARAGGVRDDDVVWDPFVGSGLELCERALLGAARAVIGTDVDARALDAARVNLDAALGTITTRPTTTLGEADARRFTPRERPTLVLSNPPMGRRVLEPATLPPLLGETVKHVADLLQPGGRLVWLSPVPEATRRAAARTALRLLDERRVDLGGFHAALQRFEKR